MQSKKTATVLYHEEQEGHEERQRLITANEREYGEVT